MSSSTVEKIKERLDIVEVVGSYVKLTKAGRHFKGLSPFSSEKTPSFFVSPDKGVFYCFSSGKGGDIFTFIQEVESVDFSGALKILAGRAGVPIEYEAPEKRSERDRLFAILDAASKFFEENLAKNKEAKDYLVARGLSEKTAADWRVGYALADWRTLHDFLLAKKYLLGDLERVGLIKKSEGGKVYDTFRDRIMFPISDLAGRIIGFSGRILHPNPESPKYLNSPDTLLFNKSEALYGLNHAKQAIRKSDFAVLVEGQMDLVMSHQAGVLQTIATSGTALTDTHLKALKKISNRLIMAFDPDQAGFKASLRGADLALSLGMEVKVAVLPKGLDPSDLVRESPQTWTQVLKDARHLLDFYLEKLLEEVKDPRTLARRITSDLLPYLKLVGSSMEQSHFVKKIAGKSGLKEEAIWEDLKKVKGKEFAKDVTQPNVPADALSSSDYLLGLYYHDENSQHALEIRNKFETLIGVDRFKEILSKNEIRKSALIMKAEEFSVNEGEKGMDTLFRRFSKDFWEGEYLKAGEDLKNAEKAGDEMAFDVALKRCQEIRRTIDDFAGKL